MQHSGPALQQLVEGASAIPSLAKMLAAGQSEAIQDQAAQLLGMLVSHFNEAKAEAVQVR